VDRPASTGATVVDPEARAAISAGRTERAVRLALVLALFGTILAVDPWGTTTDARFSAPKAFCLGLAAVAASGSLLRRPLVVERFDVLWAGYLGAGVLSAALAAPSFRASAAGLAPDVAALIVLLAVRAACARSSGFAARAHGLLVLAATALSAIVLCEALGAVPFHDLTRRPGATLGNRNFMAAFVAMALPLAALRFARAPSWLRAIPIVLAALAITLSRTRSVWLGAAVALVAVAAAGVALRGANRGGPPRRRPRARSMATIAAVAVAGVIVAVVVPWPGLAWREEAPFLGTVSRMGEIDRGSGKLRADQHRVAMALVADAPLWGGGPRTWPDRAARRAHAIRGAHAPPYGAQKTPHSDWLRVTSENGLIGLLFVAGLTVTVLAKLRRRLVAAPPEGLALLAALTVAGVHATVDVPFFRPESLAALAVLVGSLGPSPPLRHAPGPGARRAVLVGLTACAMVLVSLRLTASVLARPGASAARLDRALRLYPDADIARRRAVARGCSPEALAAVDDALALAPHQWGLLRFGQSCARRVGRPDLADDYGRRAMAVEPHALRTEPARSAPPDLPDR